MGFKKFMIDLLFPVTCLGCQQTGLLLCPDCFKNLKFSGLNINLPIPYLDRLHSAGDYQDKLLAHLIKSYKFKNLPTLGEPLGYWLALSWQGSAWLFNAQLDDIVVVPIPLSKKRQRQRGFNQAAILAKFFSLHFNYPLQLDLVRNGQQVPQSSLNQKQRLTNIIGAFKWSKEPLTGKTIILIDDVTTTGATLNEAARVLKQAGAAKVYGLTLAKG